MQAPKALDFHRFDPATGAEAGAPVDLAPLGDIQDRVVDIGPVLAVSAGPTLHGLDPVRLTPRWTRALGDHGAVVRVEASLGTLLVVSIWRDQDPSGLLVVDGKDGTPCWSEPQLVHSWIREAVVAGDQLYVMTTYPPRMIAYRLASGDKLWEWSKPREGTIWPWILGGAPHVATSGRGIERLDPAGGGAVRQWDIPLASLEIVEGPAPGTIHVLEPPDRDGPALLDRSAVSAWSLAEGRRLWQSPARVSEHAVPFLDGSTLYACTEDGRIRALDTASGAEIWSYGLEEREDIFPGSCQLFRAGGALVHRVSSHGDVLTGFRPADLPVAAARVTVRGHVHVDGKPRAGALIQAGDEVVRTDGAGRYELRVERRGALQVTLDCEGLRDLPLGRQLDSTTACWKSTREGEQRPARVDFDLKTVLLVGD